MDSLSGVYGFVLGASSGDASGLAGYELLIDLTIAVAAAFLGGIIASKLKLPVMTGYLLGGICIGPFTPGPHSDVHRVQTLAELGVALLMFALGTQFSLHELKLVGKGAAGGGILQVLLTIFLGVPVGLILGMSFTQALYLGGMLAISSSIVILKLLLSRSEVEALQGRLALGIGVVQDISVVVLVVVLPALAAPDQGDLTSLLVTVGLALLKAVAFLGITYLVGTRVIPWILYRIISLGLREMFLLTILIIAVGTALLAQLIGLSFALGAFLAGMIVSESDAADDVLNEIIPLRDVFASLFFVSIGMLINPVLLWENIWGVLLVVVVILVGKFGIVAGLLLLFKYPFKASLRAGLLLSQIGEFSFVLARTGVDQGALTIQIEALVLSGALITIILTPVLYQFLPPLFDRLDERLENRRVQKKAARVAGQLSSEEVAEAAAVAAEPVIYDWEGRDPRLDSMMRNLSKEIQRDHRSSIERWPYKKHVVICGYGRVGRELAEAVRRRNFEVVIIEYDLRRAAEATARGMLVFTGDATREIVLKQARVDQAKVLAVTTPDLPTAEAITQEGRRLNKDLEIITRSSDVRAIRALRQAGAVNIVQPEIEAGLEFIRRTLRSYGVSGVELQSLINGRREKHYGRQK